jgi:O-methyltransferase involved in polyketide biosynthesis
MKVQSTSENKPFRVPSHLLRPLWLRSRESLLDNASVYDPIAAHACNRCELATECLRGNVDQNQLLHVSLAQICDIQVSHFLELNPNGLIINVGAELDTRFYRLDNGRCQWIELDVSENLLWRQKLFHRSERYQLACGSIDDMSWLSQLSISCDGPVLILCEQALLMRGENHIAHFVQSLGCYFSHAELCMVVAGDKAGSQIGKAMGCEQYQHGIHNIAQKAVRWLPWIYSTRLFSPLDQNCRRWARWQRIIAKIPSLKHRLTPVVLRMKW